MTYGKTNQSLKKATLAAGLGALLLGAGLAAQPATADEATDAFSHYEKMYNMGDNKNQGGNQQAGQQGGQGAQPLLEMPPLRGPKRTVAIGKFTAVGGFTQKYGDWAIGDGLGAMLTTALVNSKQFIVLERARLNKTLSEQELKASGMTRAGGPKLGAL